MISLGLYLKRRRIGGVREWVELNKIKSYKEMSDLLLVRGIRPPPEKDVKEFFATEKKVEAPQRQQNKRRRKPKVKSDFSKVEIVNVKKKYETRKIKKNVTGSVN